MQAIHTRYLGPTNYRGSRIVARAAAGRRTFGWNHALNPADNHRAAALALRNALGWTGDLVSGTLPDGSYAHVFRD